MESQTEPNIVGADRFKNSLIIAFSDGRIASFSSALLYATIGQALEFPPEVDDENVELN